VPPLSIVLNIPGLLRLPLEELQVESFLAWEEAAAVLPCRAEEEEVVAAAGVEEQACCVGLNLISRFCDVVQWFLRSM
jgi:hypothetical protein